MSPDQQITVAGIAALAFVFAVAFVCNAAIRCAELRERAGRRRTRSNVPFASADDGDLPAPPDDAEDWPPPKRRNRDTEVW